MSHPEEPRDLSAEQAELRGLLERLPWLKLRQALERAGIPATTFKAYLAPAESANYRHLRDVAHADALWQLLHDTAAVLAASLRAAPAKHHLLVEQQKSPGQ